jgi:hypothetical protein
MICLKILTVQLKNYFCQLLNVCGFNVVGQSEVELSH